MAKESDKKEKQGAHGLTKGSHKELHHLQNTGAEPEMVAANGNDAAGYQVRKDESHMVHVQLEIPNFSAATGERLSKGFVQKYGVKEFEAAKANGGFAGYATKILHAPKEAAQELGVAAVGTRVVDSNFAAMQEKYEALTGERPESDWTPAMLDAAVRTAERLHGRFQSNATQPQAMKQSAAESNTPAVVANVATAEAVLRANTTEATTAADVATAAAEVGNNTPPTQDGTTSVGQATIPAVAADTAPEPAPVNAGRRGAPVATTRPSAVSAETKAPARAAEDK